MTLRLNDDGEWTMPRGLSVHDMAYEIKDALLDQPPCQLPVARPTRRDLTIARQYVKVTHVKKGY